MDFSLVRDNLAQLREVVSQVQAQHGLTNDVRIIAVTKGHTDEAIKAAYAAGLKDVGENRVQEALGKRERTADVGVDWHLIGHLQTNKAKAVPGIFTWVQSVDSLKIAEALSKSWQKWNENSGEGESVPLKVLIQVNVAGEEQKTGCSVDEAPEVVNRVSELPGLDVRGMMTMAPFVDDEKIRRETFCGLRILRDRIETDGLKLPELSMGMSQDFPEAVAEGATMVRVGTVLFGGRS
ncbi:MAG: YggS family pyridoxal phosphate-dependent enzyme [Gemmatimonadota bacterium]|nr:YggS family pyridoxal phosphate-dependent enzyme [Gemmatimonadota bacterium]